MGVRRGGNGGFEIISKKRLFFQFRGVKNKFHHFWPPLEKILGKSPTGPPGRNPSDAHALHPFSRSNHFFAELCNSITRQPIDLESCSNHQQTQQVS